MIYHIVHIQVQTFWVKKICTCVEDVSILSILIWYSNLQGGESWTRRQTELKFKNESIEFPVKYILQYWCCEAEGQEIHILMIPHIITPKKLFGHI